MRSLSASCCGYSQTLRPTRLVEVDAVAVAGEAQLDAVVARADGARAAELAERVEHLDGALLEDAGADRALDLLARARVDDDRFDARAGEQVRQQQAGGSGADDGDSGADGGGHGVSFDGCYQRMPYRPV